MAVSAEAIARYCLVRILLTPELLKHYVDEASMDAFWSLGPADRRAFWGEPLDLATVRATCRLR
jgi:hypothetical protein